MKTLLVSACLLGVRCKYSGGDNLCPRVAALREQYQLIPVCPEQLGGLPTPRAPAERQGDRVMTKDGQDAGYCVEVAPTGFGGGVDTMVGIGVDGTITGISIISASSETPGLGANSTKPEFQEQFAGQPADGTVAVEKDGGSIVALTGATITSRAVSEGVNAAVKFAAEQG